MVSLKLEVIQPLLLDCKDPSLLERAYSFYKRTWNSELESISRPTVSSDDFKLFERIVVLIDHDEIVGLSGLSFHDTRLQFSSDAALIREVPEHSIARLKKEGMSVLARFNAFTVSRRSPSFDSKISLSEVLLGTTLKVFLDTKADTCVAITRNTRGVDKMSRRHGAVTLGADFEFNDEPASVMYFPRNNTVISQCPRHLDVINSIWDRNYNFNQPKPIRRAI